MIFPRRSPANGALITDIRSRDGSHVLPNGTRQRTPFPGNIIPTGSFSPVAQARLQYHAAYRICPGDPATGQNNYIYSADSTLNSNKYDLRTDANFTETTRMFVRFSRQQEVPAVPGTLCRCPPAAAASRQTLHAVRGRFNACIFTNPGRRHPVRFHARFGLAVRRVAGI